jgi:geranylgeranyl diphosphate synthase type II
MADDGSRVDIAAYLREVRALVVDEIRRFVPRDGAHDRVLYDLMMDYPLRDAKGLRPALCVATCRALGGSLEAVLPSAAVIELYHNAFLVHDDVEDGSELRRDAATLHRRHGVPIAVNVGDAMLALTLGPLLDNMRTLDMGRALRVLQVVSRMARESAEGQAVELDWIRHARWDLSDADYLRMVEKKTGWYSFIAPVWIGAIVAGAPSSRVDALVRFAERLGAAFQIQDDVLNLVADEGRYGKEITGDLWEGKHTLMLLHAMRSLTGAELARAQEALARARPATLDEATAARLRDTLDALGARGSLDADARREIERALQTPGARTEGDVRFLRDCIVRTGGIEHARAVALARAREAGHLLDACDWLAPSVHRALLRALVDYVIERDR